MINLCALSEHALFAVKESLFRPEVGPLSSYWRGLPREDQGTSLPAER